MLKEKVWRSLADLIACAQTIKKRGLNGTYLDFAAFALGLGLAFALGAGSFALTCFIGVPVRLMVNLTRQNID